jgi:hypothetical protein
MNASKISEADCGPRTQVFWFPRDEREYCHYRLQREVGKLPSNLPDEFREVILKRVAESREKGRPEVRYNLMANNGRCAGAGWLPTRYLESMLDACLICSDEFLELSEPGWQRILEAADRPLVKDLFKEVPRLEIEQKATWFIQGMRSEVPHRPFIRSIRDEILAYENANPTHFPDTSHRGNQDDDETFKYRLLDCVRDKINQLNRRLSPY